jgi:NCAIR mutase (PurE)-related protein
LQRVQERLRELLKSFARGEIDLDEAQSRIKLQSFRAVGEMAKLDVCRADRIGMPEDSELVHNSKAKTVVMRSAKPKSSMGKVGILAAGTADMPAAEEARVVAEEMGCTVLFEYDVGVAGIHRLFPCLERMADVDAFVVAAGREGTLPAVVAGLVEAPVIGLPVSTGYGLGGSGRAALYSMLQSCSVLTVVNIDAGFVAGAYAAKIARQKAYGQKQS